MPLLDFVAQMDSIIELTPDIRLFKLKLDKEINFKAGQFVNIIFEDENQKYVRPYSIASPPQNKNILELCVKLVKEGKATPHLWHKKVGDIIKVKGPSGSFNVKENDRNKVFIGSGTGLAPLRSMIYDLISKVTHSKLTLILGVRFDNEIPLREEFENLEKNNPNFTFIPVVSKPSPDWKGKKGHVQDDLSPIDLKNSDFYLCGVPAMVEETKTKLLENGVSTESIMHEKF